jgi:hypothetical protein
MRSRKCGLTNTADAAAMSRVVTDQGMIGNSCSMQEVKNYITRVAPTDSTVLITGETFNFLRLSSIFHKIDLMCHIGQLFVLDMAKT